LPSVPESAPDRTIATLVAIGIVALLGGVAAGVALSRITSDEDSEARPGSVSAPAATGAERSRERDRSANTEQEAPPRRRLLLEWPDDLTAHTVILVTTSDRAAARRLARQTARSGIEAGLLRGDDYDLGAGLWVVFAGRFDTAEGAARQAGDLAERFPGAYPKLVEPAG
jgi:sporulation related protein